jgi:hypothetical protein
LSSMPVMTAATRAYTSQCVSMPLMPDVVSVSVAVLTYVAVTAYANPAAGGATRRFAVGLRGWPTMMFHRAGRESPGPGLSCTGGSCTGGPNPEAPSVLGGQWMQTRPGAVGARGRVTSPRGCGHLRITNLYK